MQSIHHSPTAFPADMTPQTKDGHQKKQNSPRMKLLKLVSAGVVALALTSSTMAQTFFDESITLQGKLIDLGYAGRVYKWSALTTNGKLSA
jgi:hypothetical protein